MPLLWWRIRYRIERHLWDGLRHERLEADYAFGPPTSLPRLSPEEAGRIAVPLAPPTARIRAGYGRCKETNRRRGNEQLDGSVRVKIHPTV